MLSAAPESCAERRGRGPSLTRPMPGGSSQAGPSPQAESPSAESRTHGVARPSHHCHLRGSGADPRETGPPSEYSPSLRAAGSALLNLLPRRRSRGSLGGRTGRWDWTRSRGRSGRAPGWGLAAHSRANRH